MMRQPAPPFCHGCRLRLRRIRRARAGPERGAEPVLCWECERRATRAALEWGGVGLMGGAKRIAAKVRSWTARRRDERNVAALLERYLEREGARHSASYRQTAEGLVRLHLRPFFGDRAIAELRREDAIAFTLQMRQRGKGAATALNSLSILRRVVEIEVESGHLSRNTLRGVGRLVADLARAEAREVPRVQAYDPVQLAQFLEIARERWLARRMGGWAYPCIAGLAWTGMRRGEALGLQWRDVDLERGEIAIRRARVRGRAVTPKNGHSRRIPADVAGPMLPALLRELPRRSDFVFTAPAGGPVDEGNLGRGWRALQRDAEHSGLPKIRLHDLRHTFASCALAAGIPAPAVAALLGHSNPATTMRVYAHALPLRPQDRGFLAMTPQNGAGS
ncbi:site-specific integrase [Myxococcota bacterium]|nr:site-specific integrase [Myxococcota bacterium]MCZ7619405.1 site-specific integrase [Myxococcota bacterium]